MLPGSTVRLKSTFKGTAPFSVHWFKGDAELATGGACYIMTEALSSYMELYAVKPADSGTYSCKVSNMAGSVVCSANLFVKGLHFLSLMMRPLSGKWQLPLIFLEPPPTALLNNILLILQNLLPSQKGWSPRI